MWFSPKQKSSWHRHTLFGGRQALSYLTLNDSCRTTLYIFQSVKTDRAQLIYAELENGFRSDIPCCTPHLGLKNLLFAQHPRASMRLVWSYENLDFRPQPSNSSTTPELSSCGLFSCLFWDCPGLQSQGCVCRTKAQQCRRGRNEAWSFYP